jgi:type I site-specific restriction-modification system R (restriction) subunit
MSKYEENGIEIDGLDEIEVENTAVDDLESESINLIFLGIDESSSMTPYINGMKNCLSEFKTALTDSKEADEILVARADFADDIKIGGYKKISEFDTGFDVYGCTAMFDTIVNGAEKLKEYRKFLKEQGMTKVKAVFAIFSDGLDNQSTHSFSEAKREVGTLDNSGKYPPESLNGEEITTAFISFGGQATQTAKDLGFRNILDVASSASELRKAFNCLSKSVIESSKSVLSDDGDEFFQI